MSMTIAGAKKFLEEQGYYTENLWHINDVKDNWECTDEQAQKVLHQALRNEWTMEQVWFSINESATELGVSL